MPLIARDARHRIALTLNGERVEGYAEPRMLLVDFLRHELGATGTHVGCEHGVCGACTIRVDGRAARACLMLAVQADGKSLETVEGLAARDGTLSPLQQAFHENFALQCGFCTPGLLMSLGEVLEHNPNPSEREIRVAIGGNICRCTGYQEIVDAALAAATVLRGDAPKSEQQD
ncbi:MAG: (2Fe-2S)-binding protein [Alphaproteobacteria bacterium]|nr:(2Fe-2S)-binding protein [Alphaproteobacteria bacterium]